MHTFARLLGSKNTNKKTFTFFPKFFIQISQMDYIESDMLTLHPEEDLEDPIDDLGEDLEDEFVILLTEGEKRKPAAGEKKSNEVF